MGNYVYVAVKPKSSIHTIRSCLVVKLGISFLGEILQEKLNPAVVSEGAKISPGTQ